MLSIGEQLRSARVMRRITQGQLAHLVETSQSAVSDWETGGAQPGIALIERVAHALGFDVIAVLVPWEVSGGAETPSLRKKRPDLAEDPS